MKSILAIISALALAALSANATEPAAELFRKALEPISGLTPHSDLSGTQILELKVTDSIANNFRKTQLYTVKFTTSDGASTTCMGSIAPLSESARKVLLDGCEMNQNGTKHASGQIFEGSVGL